MVAAAICLINAFRNGANEQAIAQVLREEAPEIYLSLSSSVAPQIREYPRASTTAINAYTTPITEPYLKGLQDRPGEGWRAQPAADHAFQRRGDRRRGGRHAIRCG